MGDGRGEIRVLLAEEQSLFREAMRAVLESEGDLVVVAEARDGLQAEVEAERTRPDVAVVNATLPNCDGVQATRLIKRRVLRCRVLLLAEEEDQGLLVDAVEAGADGFLTKESPLGELIEATRALHRGETLIPPRMLGPLLAWLLQKRRAEDHALRRMSELTRRERQVLALLAEGGGNDSIAQVLVISPQTARTHVQNVLSKLGVHSRLEAVALVTQAGLLGELAGAGP